MELGMHFGAPPEDTDMVYDLGYNRGTSGLVGNNCSHI